jgi:ubiquinone/menaquinone biosynthesis C-methylase UbiE
MTQPPSLFGAREAAVAYESNLVTRVFLPFAERFVNLAAPTRHEDVLDLACGTGAVTRIVAGRCGPDRVKGIDNTDAMLEVARSLLPNVTFLHGSFDNLPVPDRRTDVVLCQQGLQFAPDRTAAVAEMVRVLRRGGRVAVSCWTDVARIPVFNAFREALLALGWDDLVQMFAMPFSLSAAELESLFRTPSFEHISATELTMKLNVGDPREMARIYATAPPFSTRFLAASEAEQQRYLDTVTAGLTDTEPFTTSVLTAIRTSA